MLILVSPIIITIVIIIIIIIMEPTVASIRFPNIYN